MIKADKEEIKPLTPEQAKGFLEAVRGERFEALYVLAIPVAAGVLYPSYGIMLRPEWSALLMSLSSIIVAVNAVLLKGVEGELDEPGSDESSPWPSPAR